MSDQPIFVDTGYLVALLNARDGLHDQAVALARTWEKKKRSFLTTDAVLIELANVFAKGSMRGPALAAIQSCAARQDGLFKVSTARCSLEPRSGTVGIKTKLGA